MFVEPLSAVEEAMLRGGFLPPPWGRMSMHTTQDDVWNQGLGMNAVERFFGFLRLICEVRLGTLLASDPCFGRAGNTRAVARNKLEEHALDHHMTLNMCGPLKWTWKPLHESQKLSEAV